LASREVGGSRQAPDFCGIEIRSAAISLMFIFIGR